MWNFYAFKESTLGWTGLYLRQNLKFFAILLNNWYILLMYGGIKDFWTQLYFWKQICFLIENSSKQTTIFHYWLIN